MANTNKLLLNKSIHVPNEVDLKWLRKNMENKIDAILCCVDQCVEYKEYETDIAYMARIKREERFEEFKRTDPDFLKYLELRERFKHVV